MFYGMSLFHQWQPESKVLGLVPLLFVIAAIDRLWVLAIALGGVVLVYGGAGLPWRRWWQRLAVLAVFCLGLGLLLLFQRGETPWVRWGELVIFWEGLRAALVLAGRLITLATLAMVLLETTTFSEWLQVLRTFGIPPFLTDVLVLSYRYIFELRPMLMRMQQAMMLRGFRPHWRRLGRIAALIGTFLIRSYDRSEQVYQAMRLRGYGLRSRQQKRTYPRLYSYHGLGIGVCWLVGIGIYYYGAK